jgi:23S rRNA pseudouridine955/2504/2580 synthase
MNELTKNAATWHEVGEEGAAQRVDNYLTRLLKGVPKSHIYRILRSGEVRVNSARVGPDHRLQVGDRLRIPPIRVAQRTKAKTPPANTPGVQHHVLYEDESLLVFNKPSGIAVHGGSGVSFGMIERLRAERPQAKVLELVHRLDRETSGILLIAKKRPALTALHAQLRSGSVHKFYFALVRGRWRSGKQTVKVALDKYTLASGERRVKVSDDGQAAHTIFRLRRSFAGYSLVEAELKTGRTHQIRVHLGHLGFPIAGDDKYGDFVLNRELAKQGLKRMFLHAYKTVIVHPETGKPMAFEAPLPDELEAFIANLPPPHA